MKCSNCGTELMDGANFCSCCGAKITAPEPPVEETTIDPEHQENKIKSKIRKLWGKLSVLGKLSTISIVASVLLGMIAFLASRIFAGVIAIVWLAVVVVALLMKKDVIKVPKTWIPLVAVILSFVLIVPYFSLFKVNMADYEKYAWDEIALADMLPTPASPYGEIIANSESYLTLNVNKATKEQYVQYVEDCKENGFTIDAETTDSFFCAYNEAGYKLSLGYFVSHGEIHISLAAGKKMGALSWPDSDMAQLLPTPTSPVGEIAQDDEKGFAAYVGNTSTDAFGSYVQACKDKGFTVDVEKSDKYFSAKNGDGYKLSIDYQGNMVIYISLEEPVYNVSIEVECVENWFFNKYDVDVYVNDNFEGTITHGDTESFDLMLTKGTYILKFVSEEDYELDGEVDLYIQKDENLKYKISCSSSGIDVDTIVGTSSENQPSDNENQPSDSENQPSDSENQPSDSENQPSDSENQPSDSEDQYDTAENTPDYANAESFEKALNDGEKVKGKTVQFEVLEYKPNSALGINCWAGEHLNFISEEELDVGAGNIIVGRVTEEPSKVLGSWKIPYVVLTIGGERIENSTTEPPFSEDQVDIVPTEITLTMGEDDFKEMNYHEAEKIFREMGFTKFEYSPVDAKNESSSDKICYIEITEWFFGDSSFVKGDKFDADSTVTFFFYEYETPAAPSPVFYSTNDYETAKNGNTGVFSYRNRTNSYDIYWIIDFDTGYVYYFTEGNGESSCDRLKIDSGTLNDAVTITYHDGGDTWSYKLHFKYVDHPETLIMVDQNGFDWEYSATDLDDALALRATKKVKDY